MSRTRPLVLLLAGLAAGAVLSPTAGTASDGSPVIQGTSNYGSTETGVFTTNNTSVSNALNAQSLGGAGGHGVFGLATRSGYSGLYGFSYAGDAVVGEVYRNSSASANGVKGTTPAGGASGVYGENSGGGYGATGRSVAPGGIGVYGDGQSYGVLGAASTASGAGVYGYHGGSGFGVYGLAGGSGGVGVRAQSSGGGAAFAALGPTKFSRSGKVTVPAGAASVTKAGVALDTTSMILATMQQRRAGITVEAAVPNPAADSFTVYLSRPVPTATTVAWFVLN